MLEGYLPVITLLCWNRWPYISFSGRRWNRMSNVSFSVQMWIFGCRNRIQLFLMILWWVLLTIFQSSRRWVSVLQNSKEEALNNAFKGDQDEGENNIVQELSKAIVGEVKRMSGNDVCCDCGASSKCYVFNLLHLTTYMSHVLEMTFEENFECRLGFVVKVYTLSQSTKYICYPCRSNLALH